VILYGTPWCGACKAARQYLSSKHIPFAYKDIENDASAARELQHKASRLGIPADRVPILDVRGRLLVGFDRTRLEALLGDAT
jgi:glutaredoxin